DLKRAAPFRVGDGEHGEVIVDRGEGVGERDPYRRATEVGAPLVGGDRAIRVGRRGGAEGGRDADGRLRRVEGCDRGLIGGDDEGREAGADPGDRRTGDTGGEVDRDDQGSPGADEGRSAIRGERDFAGFTADEDRGAGDF